MCVRSPISAGAQSTCEETHPAQRVATVDDIVSATQGHSEHPPRINSLHLVGHGPVAPGRQRRLCDKRVVWRRLRRSPQRYRRRLRLRSCCPLRSIRGGPGLTALDTARHPASIQRRPEGVDDPAQPVANNLALMLIFPHGSRLCPHPAGSCVPVDWSPVCGCRPGRSAGPDR